MGAYKANVASSAKAARSASQEGVEGVCVCVCGRQRIIERCLALDKPQQRTQLEQCAPPIGSRSSVGCRSPSLSRCLPLLSFSFLSLLAVPCPSRGQPHFLACCPASSRQKRQKINKMAPSAGHWLSYGVREEGEGVGHTHSIPTPTWHANAMRASPSWALLQLADSLCAPFTPLYAPTPLHCTSVADMIYALMSRFFDKVLNL